MRLRKAGIGLAMVGLVTTFIGLYIRTLDRGSCPAETVSHFVPCYHTFPNTNIYIWPTGTFVAETGFAVLLAGVALFFYDFAKASKMTRAVSTGALGRAAGVLAIALIIAAGLFGYALSNLTQDHKTTLTTTKTSTITRIFGQETITEVLVMASGIDGGGGFCQGKLSPPESCVGGGTVQVTYSNATSYVFPSDLHSVILNATITTVISSTTMSCGSATTSSTTMSYNSTSGYGWVQWTWSQTCH